MFKNPRTENSERVMTGEPSSNAKCFMDLQRSLMDCVGRLYQAVRNLIKCKRLSPGRGKLYDEKKRSSNIRAMERAVALVSWGLSRVYLKRGGRGISSARTAPAIGSVDVGAAIEHRHFEGEGVRENFYRCSVEAYKSNDSKAANAM